MVLSYNAWLTRQVKETLAPLPAAIDGAKKEVMDLRAEVARLEGEEAGQAKEKAEQAIKDSATVAALASVPPPTNPTPNSAGSIPTAANPVLTEDRAKELMENQTVTADRGEGWTPKTEPDAPQELRRGREEE